MSDSVTTTSDVLDQQRVAADLASTLTPIQRCLLQLLANAQQHAISPGPAIDALARECGTAQRQTLQAFSSAVSDGCDWVSALNQHPGVLPTEACLAIELADAQGLRATFLDAWLLDQPATMDFQQRVAPAWLKLAATCFKASFMLAILSFLLLNVVPELEMILAEFGIAPTTEMQRLLGLSEVIPMLTMLLSALVIFLAIAGGLYYRHELNSILGYFKPSAWRTKPAVPSVTRLWVVAWLCDAKSVPLSEGLQRRLGQFLASAGSDRNADWQAGVLPNWQALGQAKIVTPREAQLLTDVRCRDTASWMLRQFAADRDSARQRVGDRISKSTRTILQLILIGLTLVAAQAILSTLVSLMRSQY